MEANISTTSNSDTKKTEVDSSPLALYEHVRSFISNILKVLELKSFRETFETFDKLLDESTNVTKIREKLKKLSEKLKDFIEKRNRKNLIGKMIKKRKEKSKINDQIVDLVADIQKLFFISQIIIMEEQQTSSSSEKLVLWVDDQPENNSNEVNSAKEKHKIQVIQKISTKEAQDFLTKQRPDLIKFSPGQFRIITDCNRKDEGEEAGLNLIKWLRSSGWITPILVYCGDIFKNLSIHCGFPNVLVASTQTQLEMFFSTMVEASGEKKKLQEEKKKSSKEEIEEEHKEPTKVENEKEPLIPSSKNQQTQSSFNLANTLWTGDCIMEIDKSRFSFDLNIVEDENGFFSGTILWSSLNNAKTRARGKFDSSTSKISFEEYQVIFGEDEVEVPMKYEGVLEENNTIMKGKNLTTDKELMSTFTLMLQTSQSEEKEKEEEISLISKKNLKEGAFVSQKKKEQVEKEGKESLEKEKKEKEKEKLEKLEKEKKEKEEKEKKEKEEKEEKEKKEKKEKEEKEKLEKEKKEKEEKEKLEKEKKEKVKLEKEKKEKDKKEKEEKERLEKEKKEKEKEKLEKLEKEKKEKEKKEKEEKEEKEKLEKKKKEKLEKEKLEKLEKEKKEKEKDQEKSKQSDCSKSFFKIEEGLLEVGKLIHIQIVVMNSSGLPSSSSGDKLVVYAADSISRKKIEAFIEEIETGVFEAKLFIVRPSTYVLYVQLNGKDISKSPIELKIQPRSNKRKVDSQSTIPKTKKLKLENPGEENSGSETDPNEVVSQKKNRSASFVVSKRPLETSNVASTLQPPEKKHKIQTPEGDGEETDEAPTQLFDFTAKFPNKNSFPVSPILEPMDEEPTHLKSKPVFGPASESEEEQGTLPFNFEEASSFNKNKSNPIGGLSLSSNKKNPPSTLKKPQDDGEETDEAPTQLFDFNSSSTASKKNGSNKNPKKKLNNNPLDDEEVSTQEYDFNFTKNSETTKKPQDDGEETDEAPTQLFDFNSYTSPNKLKKPNQPIQTKSNSNRQFQEEESDNAPTQLFDFNSNTNILHSPQESESQFTLPFSTSPIKSNLPMNLKSSKPSVAKNLLTELSFEDSPPPTKTISYNTSKVQQKNTSLNPTDSTPERNPQTNKKRILPLSKFDEDSSSGTEEDEKSVYDF